MSLFGKKEEKEEWVVALWHYGLWPEYLNADHQETYKDPRKATLMTLSVAKEVCNVMHSFDPTGDKVEVVSYKDALNKYLLR